jgi:hypothetical protein
MPKLSENGRRIAERWTLFAGGVEMLIGASLGAFPDVFPWWLTIIALAIATVTIGVGLMLIWTDIRKLSAILHLRPSQIGPIVSVVGLVIIFGLGLWYFVHAPKGTFAGSSVGVILAAAILIVLFVLLGPKRNEFREGPQAGESAELDAEKQKNAQIEKNRLHERIRVLDRVLHRLMGLEVGRLERVVMTQLIIESPKFSDDEDISTDSLLMGDRTSQLQRFVSLVLSQVHTMQGGGDLALALHTTETHEVARLKNSPDVAPGVNAHVYRDYAVAVAKRKRVIEYMKKAIEDSERSDMAFLAEMKANEKNLNPSIFDSGF